MADLLEINNSGAKIFGGLFAIFAVIAGVYAMVKPMNQRIDSLYDQLQQMRDHVVTDDIRQREGEHQAARMSERFKEVETQFAGVRERITIELDHIKSDIDELVGRDGSELRLNASDAAQWERVKALERKVYGMSPRVPVGEAPGSGN